MSVLVFEVDVADVGGESEGYVLSLGDVGQGEDGGPSSLAILASAVTRC